MRGISHGLQLGKQCMAPTGIRALHAAQMAQVMSVAHESCRCQLHGGAGSRRETHDCFGEARNQGRRCDDEAESKRRADRLAERTDVDDASGGVH